MKVLRFKNEKPEWETPLPELALDIKKALRIQWREFIHEIEDAEDSGNECISTDLVAISMLEKVFKAT